MATPRRTCGIPWTSATEATPLLAGWTTKDATALRNRHRQLTVLPDAEFRMLTAQALACADTLAANLQASARITQAMRLSLDKAGLR